MGTYVPPPPAKRASYIQLETTRVEDKKFAACKAVIKIYLQQNKGISHTQSILIILVSMVKCWRLRLWPVVCVLQTYCFGPNQTGFSILGTDHKDYGSWDENV